MTDEHPNERLVTPSEDGKGFDRSLVSRRSMLGGSALLAGLLAYTSDPTQPTNPNVGIARASDNPDEPLIILGPESDPVGYLFQDTAGGIILQDATSGNHFWYNESQGRWETDAELDVPALVAGRIDVGPGYKVISPDDSLTPQDAIDALPAGGGTVVVTGPDTYTLDAATIDADHAAAIQPPDNVTLITEDTVTYKLADSQDTSIEHVGLLINADPTNGNSNIIVVGGQWDGNKAGQGTPSGTVENWDVVDFFESDDIEMRDIEVFNAVGDGIDTDNCDDVRAIENFAHDCDGFGIHIVGGPRGVARDNRTENNGQTHSRGGIDMQLDDSTITGHVSKGDHIGIRIRGPSVARGEISKNRVLNPDNEGIQVTDVSPDHADCRVIDNIVDSATTGIFDRGSETLIAGNTVTNCTTDYDVPTDAVRGINSDAVQATAPVAVRLTQTSAQTINTSSLTTLKWDAAAELNADAPALGDVANDGATVPSNEGFGFARVTLGLRMDNRITMERIRFLFGGTLPAGAGRWSPQGQDWQGVLLSTGWVPVSGGDTITAQFEHSQGTNQNTDGDNSTTFMKVEVR